MLHLNAPEELRAAAGAAKARARARLPVSARQQIDRIRVRAILRGDGRPGKHDADASHLSEAAEAGCRAFLTRDGKILRKRDTLRLALPDGMRILTLVEFFSHFGEDMTDGARDEDASLWTDTSR